jgi:hypothetical protein
MQIKNTLLKADNLRSANPSHLYRRATHHSLRIFLLDLLGRRLMGIVSSPILDAFALAAQSSPAHAPPVLLGCLDSVTPALPHGRPRTVEA